MTKRKTALGQGDDAQSVSMVGKGKTPESLAARLGSAELISKAGTSWMYRGDMNRRVVRRSSQG